MIEPYTVHCDYPGCTHAGTGLDYLFGPALGDWLAEYPANPTAGRHLCPNHRPRGFAELDSLAGLAGGPPMKCFKCEKAMRMLPELSRGRPPGADPDDGGTLEVHFGYGSRFDMGPPGGPNVPVDQSRAEQLVDRYRAPGDPERPQYRLYAFVCDECFERHAALVFGYTADARGRELRRDL